MAEGRRRWLQPGAWRPVGSVSRGLDMSPDAADRLGAPSAGIASPRSVEIEPRETTRYSIDKARR